MHKLLCRLCNRQAVWGRGVRFPVWKSSRDAGEWQKDPQELRGFLNDVRQAAYTIRNHMERNFGEQEQTFTKDDFSFEEPPKQAPKKEKKEKQPER